MPAPALPMPGSIFRHARYYRTDDGWQPKFLLVLAADADSLVYRLLTSRAHGRPEAPPCYHGDPYPGFYLGLLGGLLTAKSWLDLRRQDDYDTQHFAADQSAGWLIPETTLSLVALCAALDCAASADDTTRRQEARLRDQRATLNCL
jgi:hypothetical protein